MNRSASIAAEYSDAIEAAVELCSDHEGMSEARILRWVAQFSDEDLPLAAKLLSQLRYFNAMNIRSMTRQLVQLAEVEIGASSDNALFIPVSSVPGGGAETVARVLRSLRDPFRPNVATMVDLHEPPDDIDFLVFVDDFSGTGDTLASWWDNVETLVRPIGAASVFAALIMTSQALARASELGDAMSMVELGVEANVLHEESGVFEKAEQQRILDYCVRTGCSNRYLRGYGESGLLLAFTHGCPNNSLPILWYGGEEWTELFRRRAI